MPSPSRALVKAPSKEVLDALAIYFPADEGFTNISLPRISFVSQDVVEETGTGRSKQIKVVVPGGTFYQEKQEVDENGKPVLNDEGKPSWIKTEIGDAIDLQVIFQRKQLKYFDQPSKSFVSSNVFDDNEEIVKLYANKAEIASGTPAELKKSYEFEDKRTNKVKSALEDNRVLYVLFEGELHQLNLRGTSMYAWLTYARSVRPSPPAVITHIESEYKESGSINWNQMVFTALRDATAEEAQKAAEDMRELIATIEERKSRDAAKAQSDKDFAKA